ncbi:WD40 repeat-like protein [Ceraceosorus guamensis]|uniref:WD40 repeat-like protein n=1 Tax=Ceraceosorus guamensis TaxID=1522189 RepID=A0A316WF13_9BASI|nr:WD40 repeat-like protein [Ceraceosorus guamensis]PWN46313.1 WD40 repeat-like protein [Ceraceosorus guamensis]
MSVLPYATLQPTYPAVFDEIASASIATDKVWLSLYALNAPSSSIHARVWLEPCKPASAEQANTEEGTERAAGVRIAKVDGKVTVKRVKGSSTDLLVSTTSSELNSSTSARTAQSQVLYAPTLLRAPRKDFGSIIRGHEGATALDVASSTAVPGLERYVAGGADGALRIGVLDVPKEDETIDESVKGADEQGEIEKLAQRRIRERARQLQREQVIPCKGHVGDIRSAQFFPSGDVILSTSSDHTARIWDAKDGTCVRVLKGHSRAVLCAAPIGRGRQVVTGGGDGTLRIYDVGEDKQIGLIGSDRYSSVNVISLRPESVFPTSDQPAQSTSVPTLAAGLASGKVQLFDLKSKSSIGLIDTHSFPLGSPPAATDTWAQLSKSGGITALAWIDQHTLITGTTEGVCSLHDVRKLGPGSTEIDDTTSDASVSIEGLEANAGPPCLLSTWRRNGAAITDIRVDTSKASLGQVDVLVATSDGLPYRADISKLLLGAAGSRATAPRVTVEYTGWEAENVGTIRLDGKGRVLCAGAEGMLKRY